VPVKFEIFFIARIIFKSHVSVSFAQDEMTHVLRHFLHCRQVGELNRAGVPSNVQKSFKLLFSEEKGQVSGWCRASFTVTSLQVTPAATTLRPLQCAREILCYLWFPASLQIMCISGWF
jgi:hypothetical protein